MKIELNTLVQRFEKYISFDTQSSDANDCCPTTPGQLTFARYLVDELTRLGLSDITLDENGYIMATLPANGLPNAPTVGFISHLDTSPDMAGGPVKSRIVENYDGGDIVLNEAAQIILSPTEFPELKDYIGQEIMVTDGTTLLGADDKAGICEIISAMEYLLQHPEIKHGKIRIAFTPDEEIGRSANRFDVDAFHADFAYTLDGDAIGGIEYENFNAAGATVTIHGRSVHTGSAKGKMINAVKLAAEWQSLLPAGEAPEFTEGYEGFYQVHKISGGVEKTTLKMLIRDHDKVRFNKRKAFLKNIADFLNAKYGNKTVEIEINDSYYNMREKIEEKMFIVDIARQAMQELGITPVCKPIRGGTDGARLSFKGLPCPNIFTGGLNFHGKFEFLPLRSMQKASETILKIVEKTGRL